MTEKKKKKETPFNTEKINKLIRSRRSVYPKQYSEKKISREIIEQILENASWAPTHKKTEPWHFVVFSGKGLEEFGQKQADFYKAQTPEKDFKADKYQGLMDTPLKASHIIAICMKRHEVLPEIEEICSVACAVQNMYLTATAYGVGAYWSTGGMTFQEEAKAYLGLAENDKVLGFFYMGYAEKEVPDNARTEISKKVEWRD